MRCEGTCTKICAKFFAKLVQTSLLSWAFRQIQQPKVSLNIDLVRHREKSVFQTVFRPKASDACVSFLEKGKKCIIKKLFFLIFSNGIKISNWYELGLNRELYTLKCTHLVYLQKKGYIKDWKYIHIFIYYTKYFWFTVIKLCF